MRHNDSRARGDGSHAVIGPARGGASRRRRTVAVLWIGAVVAGLPAATAVAADALSDDNPCPVHAVARGMQVTISQSDNLVIQDPTGPGVPVAHACVDYSVRDSQAFASSPYPGDALVGLPGILSGQLPPPAPPLPSYPAYAGSRYPSQQQSAINQPGMALVARSSETASQAQASHTIDQAPAASVATAETSVDPAARTSAATAKADLQPLTINGVLGLGEVVSVASAKLTTAGAVDRSSQLQIGRTTVAGQEVVITPNGVQAAGQTVGTPDTGAVQDQLAQAGVTVHYLAAQNTARGVWSAGVEITATSKDPNSGAVTTVRYLVGRAFATVAPVDATSASGDDAGFGFATPVSDSGSSAVSSGGAPGVAPAVPLAAAAPAAGVQPPAAAGAPQPATGQVALAGQPVGMGLGSAYLVIVFGAMALLVGGTLVRLLGVRTRWTS